MCIRDRYMDDGHRYNNVTVGISISPRRTDLNRLSNYPVSYTHLDVYKRQKSNRDIYKVVQCPNCKTNLKHSDSVSTTTEAKREDTMTT